MVLAEAQKKCDHNEVIITVNITWYNRLYD